MHLPTLLPLSLLLLLTNPTSAALGKHFGVKRDTKCFYQRQNHMFPPTDFTELALDLLTRDPHGQSKLIHHNAIPHQWGILLVCVQNKFLQLWDTHVEREQIGYALERIYEKCCAKGAPGACAGGYAQMKGDDGLFVDVVTYTQGEDCEAWGVFG
ncbi:MAG: hypothetical protein LQ339_002096 [Xanthoria mediterranea]|nr:MAG: hypothetical protein LQ339_002096 [Xanthoria mediterranea]